MANAGPTKRKAELLYDAFAEIYPEELQTKFGAILINQDSLESKEAFATLSIDDLVKLLKYQSAVMKFEEKLFQAVIIEPPSVSFTPQYAEQGNPKVETFLTGLEQALKQQEDIKNKNLASPHC